MKNSKEKVLCVCGCGRLRLKYTNGRERNYIWGHKNRFKKGKNYSIETQFKKGHKLNPEFEIKRRINISISKKGKKFAKEHCENIKKGKTGVPNPKVSILLKGKIREQSRNWKGGLSFEPYGSEFNKELKEEIRKRDNYICQYCFKLQEELGEKLSTHHIDYNKKNNSSINLISLCRKCHLQTNENRDFWERYFIMYQYIKFFISNKQDLLNNQWRISNVKE